MSYRLQRAIVNYQVDEKKAADIIMKNDKRRRNYYNYHVGEKWADLNNYDLVIRSDMCGIANAVKCIITYMVSKQNSVVLHLRQQMLTWGI